MRAVPSSWIVVALVVGASLGCPANARASRSDIGGPSRWKVRASADLRAPSERIAAPADAPDLRLPSESPASPTWRRAALGSAYAGLYMGAAKVGARLGLEDHFVVRRLETAWIIDVFGHVYATRHTASFFERLHRWAGHDARSARVHGAWSAAFGALTYMEIINGFMPNVRFDWLDPVSNAAGALMVSEGPDLVDAHPWLRRLSFELGYDDWSRLTEPDDETGPFTRIWHDYPNQRWGIGYGLGPVERPWFRVFGTYGVTALDIEQMRQEWGLGVELKPHHWLDRWIRRVPGGARLLDVFGVLDRHLLVPGLYVHLVTWETEPFSDREPFQE